MIITQHIDILGLNLMINKVSTNCGLSPVNIAFDFEQIVINKSQICFFDIIRVLIITQKIRVSLTLCKSYFWVQRRGKWFQNCKISHFQNQSSNELD